MLHIYMANGMSLYRIIPVIAWRCSVTMLVGILDGVPLVGGGGAVSEGGRYRILIMESRVILDNVMN